jgi:hypothetical protein
MRWGDMASKRVNSNTPKTDVILWGYVVTRLMIICATRFVSLMRVKRVMFIMRLFNEFRHVLT